MPITFEYNRISFEEGPKIDLLVENRVIVTLKSIEKLAPVHGKQLLTYLRLTNPHMGLLINFRAATLKERILRVVNNLNYSPTSTLSINQKDHS